VNRAAGGFTRCGLFLDVGDGPAKECVRTRVTNAVNPPTSDPVPNDDHRIACCL
jgi:hypothetical protein